MVVLCLSSLECVLAAKLDYQCILMHFFFGQQCILMLMRRLIVDGPVSQVPCHVGLGPVGLLNPSILIYSSVDQKKKVTRIRTAIGP